MKRMQRAAILTEVADQLTAQGSWCGETHIQKGTYFLQELLRVPTGFEFILYKFGPYSFDLGDELTALRADELFELKVRRPSYGPSYETTETSRALRQRFDVTLGRYGGPITFVARTLGSKGVTELERLATALFVTLAAPRNEAANARARRLHALKPHVTIERALSAVHEFDAIADQASRFVSEPAAR